MKRGRYSRASALLARHQADQLARIDRCGACGSWRYGGACATCRGRP